MTTQDELHKITDIMKRHPICMLTTQGTEGLTGRPMTVAKVEDDGEVWFFSSAGSEPVEDISVREGVNVTFAGKDQWLSVRGSAAVITSEPKAREMWNQAVAAFYPEGPGSEDLVLLRIRPEGAQYWESPGGTIATIFNWAKARISGTTIDAGESHTVEL